MNDASSPDTAQLPLTLGIDIGGSHLKAGLLDARGDMVGERHRVDTPADPTPAVVCDALIAMGNTIGHFDRISIGFPGVVRSGRVLTAPHLGTQAWRNFPLAARLADALGKPARLLNDAEVAGLGVISGHGVECVITLGTGMGFALFQDGLVAPHLEMSHHPVHGGHTYDEYVGEAAREKVGKKRWNKRVERVIGILQTVVTYDTLYIGGGNTKFIRFPPPEGVQIVANEAGITGGVRLWDPVLDRLFPSR
ncbi:MAG: ROK family protein [Rhodospirillales bacterium]|nr:ROK family protein [Rhodospirillales bacterium]MBN8903105.1 ROK family protein [Rhodospirillales bacterium]